MIAITQFQFYRILTFEKLAFSPVYLDLEKDLNPVDVIFFKKCQKNYKWWSDPVVVNFFEIDFFSFQKRLQV